MRSKQKRRFSGVTGNLALLASSLVVALGLLELALRITPNRFQSYYAFRKAPGERILFEPDSVLGYRLAPNQSGRARGWCYDINPLETNSLGFRDDEPDGIVQVSVLGDSYVQAANIGPSDHVVSLMEILLDQDVLGLGVAGYQTHIQEVAFRAIAGAFQPKAAVLFFFIGNDISDNLCETAASHHAYCARVDGDSVSVISKGRADEADRRQTPKGRTADSAETDLLRRSLVSYHALAPLKRLLVGLIRGNDATVPELRIFDPSTPGSWSAAWAATEDALVRFDESVRATGATPIVAIIPWSVAVDPNWRTALAWGSGVWDTEGIDLDYPAKRLTTFLENRGVEAIDLTAEMRRYRDRHNLTPPYFSLRCDRHWSPLGHLIAALSVVQRLHDVGVLTIDSTRLAGLERIRALPPQALLGSDAYRQIYGGTRGGIFQGNTSLRTVLEAEVQRD